MYVTVDVIRTEAVITFAERTVTELQFRMISVRFSANAAFVTIATGVRSGICGTPFGCAGRLFKGNDVGYMSGSTSVKESGEIRPAENNKTDNGDKRKKYCYPAAGDCRPDRREKDDDGVGNCKPFYFYWDEKEEKYALLRKQNGKGKKHGHVQVVRMEKKRCPENVVDCKTQGDMKDDAEEIICCKSSCPPDVFQRTADEIIKVKRDQQPERPAGRKNDPGNQPPHFPAHDP